MIDNQFLDPDYISLDARNQINRQDIEIIVDESSQNTYLPIPGTVPEEQANKNQINGYAGLDGSAKIPNALINLLNASNALGSDIPLTSANTFYDGPSISLSAGKWLVMAQVTFGRTVSAVCAFTGRLTNGSTFYASGEISAPSATFYQTLTLCAIVVLVSTTTVKFQGACTAVNGVMAAAAADNASGNTASGINAIRIG